MSLHAPSRQPPWEWDLRIPPRSSPSGCELSPAVSIARVAEIGSLVGDPARANMLVALLEQGTLTAKQLADRAGVTPQTASGHLAKLKAAGLVRMERVGRCHVHRLAGARVVDLIETLHHAGEDEAGLVSVRRSSVEIGVRVVRTCRDHLAGRLAVDLADALTEPGGDHLVLSREGRRRLVLWGLDLSPVSHDDGRCRRCLDWSEGRPHLAGTLGAAILGRSVSLGWLKRERGRSVVLTPAGSRGFRQRFGVGV